MPSLKKTLKYLFFTFLIWSIGHVTYICMDGFRDEHTKADLALILGSKVNEDGSLSERLEKRLECGLELYKTGRVKKVLVSGGFGKEGFYEGDKMREYLLSNGIPDSLIIVDNQGNNTRASVINTLKLRESVGFESVIVVSQYFHITRTKMLFRKHKFTNVSGASPVYFEIRDPYSIAREFVGYYTQM